MTSYIMYYNLKPSVFWKFWKRGFLTLFFWEASDGLHPALA